jgi:hypothetical protein
VAPPWRLVDRDVRHPIPDFTVEPDRHDRALETADQELRVERPGDERGPQREVALRARNETPGENLPNVHDEAALNEAPRLVSEAISAPESAH